MAIMNGAVIYPGQRVVTSAGDVVTVALVRGDGVVLAWRHGQPMPVPVHVRTDAFGGEHDQSIGLAA